MASTALHSATARPSATSTPPPAPLVGLRRASSIVCDICTRQDHVHAVDQAPQLRRRQAHEPHQGHGGQDGGEDGEEPVEGQTRRTGGDAVLDRFAKHLAHQRRATSAAVRSAADTVAAARGGRVARLRQSRSLRRLLSRTTG